MMQRYVIGSWRSRAYRVSRRTVNSTGPKRARNRCDHRQQYSCKCPPRPFATCFPHLFAIFLTWFRRIVVHRTNNNVGIIRRHRQICACLNSIGRQPKQQNGSRSPQYNAIKNSFSTTFTYRNLCRNPTPIQTDPLPSNRLPTQCELASARRSLRILQRTGQRPTATTIGTEATSWKIKVLRIEDLRENKDKFAFVSSRQVMQ